LLWQGLINGKKLNGKNFIQRIIEGLSLSLGKKHLEGSVTGIKVSRLIRILHIMFVDDVLIMTKASFTEWQEIHSLLYSFCGASRLEINVNKSIFHHFSTSQILLDNLNALFHFGIMNLEEGFKYLGYFLKIS
jgi:hypothetical protein